MIRYFIIFVLTFVVSFCLFDSGLFNEPGQSFYNAFCVSSVILAGIALAVFVLDIRKEQPTLLFSRLIRVPEVWLMVCWLTYILIHGWFIDSEPVKRDYLFCSCLLFISLSVLMEKKTLKPIYVQSMISIAALVASVVCVLQMLGLLESPSRYFLVSGTYINPNNTALLLVAAIPFHLSRLGKATSHRLNSIVLVLFGVVLIFLKCRSAWLALGLMLLYVILKHHELRQFRKYMLMGLLGCIIFFVINVFEFNKIRSSAGRMFIWDRTLDMIIKKPLFGYGYGQFEKYYNLEQVEYFKTHTERSLEARLHARHINMAYNDYLEHFVQGGFFGLLFYLSFLSLMLYRALKIRNTAASLLVLSVIIISAVNYVEYSFLLWFTFLFYGAYLSSQTYANRHFCDCQPSKKGTGADYALIGVAIIILLFFSIKKMMTVSAHLHIKSMQENLRSRNYLAVVRTGDKYYKYACNTKEFAIPYSRALLISNTDARKAERILLSALRATSSTILLYSIADFYKLRRDYKKSEQTLSLIYFMIPTESRVRYQLFCLYESSNQLRKAESMANEILALPYRNGDKKTKKYRARAQKFLCTRVEHLLLTDE